MNKLKALIFDLDGTLVATEDLYHRADHLFLQNHGISLEEESRLDIVGMGSKSFIQWLMAEHDLDGQVDELLAEKDRLYLDLVAGGIETLDQMVNFAHRCSTLGFPMAVASGSTSWVIEEVLAQVGIRELFSVVVSSQAVEKGKPAPDVFHLAAKKLAVETKDCLIVEDSIPGVEGALNAGARTLAVPHIYGPSLHPVYSQAHYLFHPEATPFRAEAFLQTLTQEGLLP